MSEFQQPPELLKDVTNVVFEEAAGYRNIPHYVYNLGLIYRRYSWWRLMSDFVREVDPIDSLGQKDPQKTVTKNFLHGTLLGLRVAHHARNAEFLEAIARGVFHTDFEAVLEEAEGERERNGLFIETIKGMGQQGLAAGDPNVTVIERWESQLCPDIATQSFLTDGFGFTLHVSHEVGRILTTQAIKQQADALADDQFDWNSGWAELGIA
jgi:hypothetical protein